MPKVPYQPYPTTEPIPGTGSQGVSIGVPGEAFGTGVAGAISSLGRSMEGAGDEVWNRAVAIKQLDQHNAATMGAADFADSAGNLHEQLKSLQGKNAVDSFQDFPDRLESERKRIRDSLPDDYTRRLYDAESRNLYNRTVMSGADWSAQQHRVSTDQAFDADIATQTKQVGMNPKDQASVDQSLANIESTTRAKWEAKGAKPNKIEYEVFSAKSTALAHAMWEQAKSDPMTAAKRLDENRSKLTQDDLNKVQDQINTQRRIVMPRNIVADLRSGASYAPGNRVVSNERAREAIGGYESGNRYNLVGVQTAHGVALGRYQVMSEFLPDFLRQAGMPQMTAQEFLRNNAAQDQLFDTVFGRYQQEHGSFNEAASRWFTGGSISDARARGAKDPLGTNVDRYLANTNALLGKSAPEREIMSDANAKADELGITKEDPVFTEFLERHVNVATQMDRRLTAEQKTEDANTLVGGLTRVGTDGQFTATMDKLFANPQMKAAYDRSDEKTKALVLNHLQANAGRGYATTPETVQRYQTMLGKLGTPEGREELATTNLLELKLPNAQFQDLQKRQNALKTGGEGDPRISGLLKDGDVQFQMDRLGITHAKDADSYYQFVGTLQQTLDAAQSQQETALSRKDIKEIFNDLTKQEVTKGFFYRNFGIGGPSLGEPFFKRTPETPAQQTMWDELMKNPTFAASDAATQQNIFAALQESKMRQLKKTQQAQK